MANNIETKSTSPIYDVYPSFLELSSSASHSHSVEMLPYGFLLTIPLFRWLIYRSSIPYNLALSYPILESLYSDTPLHLKHKISKASNWKPIKNEEAQKTKILLSEVLLYWSNRRSNTFKEGNKKQALTLPYIRDTHSHMDGKITRWYNQKHGKVHI